MAEYQTIKLDVKQLTDGIEAMNNIYGIAALVIAMSIPTGIIAIKDIYQQNTVSAIASKAIEKGQDPIKAVCAVNLKDYKTACNELLGGK